MPLNYVFNVEFFYVWGIDFMGMFFSSHDNKYGCDYVSKWITAIASPINGATVVARFFKRMIFCRYGCPDY